MAAMDLSGGFLTILMIVTVIFLMNDMTSNTATDTVAIPIVIGIVQGIGLKPIPHI